MLRLNRVSGLLLVFLWASCTFDTSNVANVGDDGAVIDGAVTGDGTVPVPDASAGADAASTDAIPTDASTCEPVCTTCDNGICVVDCSTDGSCEDEVICPAGLACEVSCGPDACSNGVDCSAAESCDIDCDGADSCAGQVECGTGPCDVTCAGANSCSNGTTCETSCVCDVDCSGAGSCANAAACPAGCGVGSTGCTGFPPGLCNACL